MPYAWTDTDAPDTAELHLWPHQSLTAPGFALFILATFALILMPLLTVMGTTLLWGLLPFMMLALGAIWWALQKSRQNAQILEILTLSPRTARLIRQNPSGAQQDWHSNRYWVVPQLYPRDGPVPNYVTLRGEGREVEIGAFLAEDERKELYREMTRIFTRQPDTADP